MQNDLSIEAEANPNALPANAAADEQTPLLRGSPPRNEEPDLRPRRRWREASIWWLLPPYFIYTLAYGGISVPKLDLILALSCREHYAPEAPGNCRIAEVQQRAARFVLVSNLAGGLLSVVTCPRIGALSDRHGRRRVLCASTLGMLVNEAVTIAAAARPERVAMSWLYVGYVFDGLCGSFNAVMAVAHSYAADCTRPAQRNTAFGYFHGCLYSGIALGPLLAGLVLRRTGSGTAVFGLALGCLLVFDACVLGFVPESLSAQQREAAREKHKRSDSMAVSTAVGSVLAPLRVLWPTGAGTSPALRRNLVLLAAMDACMTGVATGSFNIVLYYSELVFGWDASAQSLFVAMVNTCRVVCLFALLPALTSLTTAARDRGRDRGRDRSRGERHGCDALDLALIRAAVLLDAVGFAGYAAAQSTPVFAASGAVAALAGVGFPTLQSALTKHVPPDQTGQLLGASGLLYSATRIVAPTLLNAIYAATVASVPHAIFLVLAAVCAAAACLSWAVRGGVPVGDSSASPHET